VGGDQQEVIVEKIEVQIQGEGKETKAILRVVKHVIQRGRGQYDSIGLTAGGRLTRIQKNHGAKFAFLTKVVTLRKGEEKSPPANKRALRRKGWKSDEGRHLMEFRGSTCFKGLEGGGWYPPEQSGIRRRGIHRGERKN